MMKKYYIYILAVLILFIPTVSFSDATVTLSVLDDLDDVTITSPSTNQTIIYNGSQWVNAAQGTSFSFSVASFTQSGGGSTTQELGTGTWLSSGAITFSASYNNGPATGGYVSHSGWSNLTMGGTGFVGPTASVASVSYPASPGDTQAFTLNATNGTSSPTSTITFTFINYVFWGVSTVASGYTESDIEGLASSTLLNTRSQSRTISASTGEYLIFSWPTRLGLGTFTVNGFSGGFQSPETVSVTNSLGYTENYYVFRSTNSNLGSVPVVVT